MFRIFPPLYVDVYGSRIYHFPLKLENMWRFRDCRLSPAVPGEMNKTSRYSGKKIQIGTLAIDKSESCIASRIGHTLTALFTILAPESFGSRGAD